MEERHSGSGTLSVRHGASLYLLSGRCVQYTPWTLGTPFSLLQLGAVELEELEHSEDGQFIPIQTIYGPRDSRNLNMCDVQHSCILLQVTGLAPQYDEAVRILGVTLSEGITPRLFSPITCCTLLKI